MPTASDINVWKIIEPGTLFYFVAQRWRTNAVADEEGNVFNTNTLWFVVGRIEINRTQDEFVAPVNYLLLGSNSQLKWYKGQNLGLIHRVNCE
jgi:hypothetical protein